MIRAALAILIICIPIIIFTSCSSCSNSVPTSTIKPTIQPTLTPARISQVTPIATPDNYTPPTDNHWISPPRVQISNFYAGATAEWPLTIYNGNANNTETTFLIQVQQPNHNLVKSGYVAAPKVLLDWITISNESPILQGQTSQEIIITVVAPEDASAPKHWEFWVIVKPDEGQFVQVQYASRWLVDMRT